MYLRYPEDTYLNANKTARSIAENAAALAVRGVFLLIFVFFKHYNGRGTQAGEFAQRADRKLGAYVGPVSSYGAVVGYV